MRLKSQVLLVINTGGNKEIKDRAVRTMIDHQVESIVYATMYHRAVQSPGQATPLCPASCSIVSPQIAPFLR